MSFAIHPQPALWRPVTGSATLWHECSRTRASTGPPKHRPIAEHPLGMPATDRALRHRLIADNGANCGDDDAGALDNVGCVRDDSPLLTIALANVDRADF